MQTNNVVTKMFEGTGRQVISGVKGANSSNTKANDIFSNLLKQGSNFLDGVMQAGKTSAVTPAVSQADSLSSYDRYQYKQNSIETSGQLMKDKITEAANDLENFAKDVIESVSEKLETTEEDVVSTMQMLGITVFDLLNPQNLAELTVELTGAQDVSALLLDADFQSLLGDVTQLGRELMSALDLNSEQMELLLSDMEVLEQSQALENAEVIGATELLTSEKQPETATQNTVLAGTEEQGSNLQAENLSESNQIVADENTGVTDDVTLQIVTREEQSASSEESEETPMEDSTEKNTGFEQNDLSGKTSGAALEETKGSTEQAFSAQVEQVTGEPVDMVETIPASAQDTYVSVDTVRVLEQLAEKVRVNNFSEMPSVEMQLNPENLGKMYVNVSSKQGVVNAQIATTNEAVKEALEAQIVELKETLQQAGVKVDAIEVTVASHEFEKNLEQGQSGEEQEAEREEELRSKNTKKIDRLDFDELADSLDEEEALIARMMKDNGNSLDYTV